MHASNKAQVFIHIYAHRTNIACLVLNILLFTDCRNAINEVGTDFILDHFDTLFSVLVHFKHADLSTLSKGWNVIMKGISYLTLLYAFFWVIPRRLKFICRCFGTLCLFHLH